MNFLYLIFSYLLGSIDFAYLVARLHGIRLEKFGDENLGATNLMYALEEKKKYSRKKSLFYLILIGLLDGLKAFVPTILFGPYAGVAAILGHCFSIFMILKTKKIPSGVGLASTIGWIVAVDYLIFLPVAVVFIPFALYFGDLFKKERGHIYSIFAYPFASLLYIIWRHPPLDVINSMILITIIASSARLIKIKRFLLTCLK